MDIGAWKATVQGVTKESDMTEQLTLLFSICSKVLGITTKASLGGAFPYQYGKTHSLFRTHELITCSMPGLVSVPGIANI